MLPGRCEETDDRRLEPSCDDISADVSPVCGVDRQNQELYFTTLHTPVMCRPLAKLDDALTSTLSVSASESGPMSMSMSPVP